MGGQSAVEFIGAIDQGTTSTRFLIFDSSGEVVASHNVEFQQYYPQSGCVLSSLSCAKKGIWPSTTALSPTPPDFPRYMPQLT